MRQGSVLNILFCFVPFWPIGTEAYCSLGDRRAHLQNTESCYSHREAIRTPHLEEEVSPGRVLFWVLGFLNFFLGGTGRITQMEGDRKGKGGLVQDAPADGHSEGEGRWEGCRNKLKSQRKMIQTSTSLLFYSRAVTMERRANTQALRLFLSPLDRWQCLESFLVATSRGRGCYWGPEGRDQGCC